MVTVACVCTGIKYNPLYVTRLKHMVERFNTRAAKFVVLTDQPARFNGIATINVAALNLPGWWNKMALFEPSIRGDERWVFIDLDTVIVGNIDPLLDWDGEFGVCQNFTQLAGHPTWPCKYGSCVMSFSPGFGRHIYTSFMMHRARLMNECPKGDQQAIELLHSHATYLQSVLPSGFFLNKRQLHLYPSKPPAEAAMVIFGGSQGPHNAKQRWIREMWY